MKDIQDWLGHSSYATTANIYAHLDTDFKKQPATKMNQTVSITQPRFKPEERTRGENRASKRKYSGFQFMKNLSIFNWCQWWDSNPHGVATNGF